MIDKNFFTYKTLEKNKELILNKFPELKACKHDNFYSLSEYIIESPSKFYDKEVFVKTELFLENLFNEAADLINFLEILDKFSFEFNHAIQTLNEINKKEIHESLLPDNDIELRYYFSEKIIYEYLKINDVILLGVLKPIAYYLRVKNNKGTDNLDIYNCIETLKKYEILENVTKKYSSTLRNSIAHGGVTYESSRIIFKDKKETRELYSWSFIKEFDDLIDSVNAIVLAYKKIFFQYLDVLTKYSISIPNSLMEIELRYKANHYGWNILHSYSSIIPKGNQYNLLVESNLNSGKFMNFSAAYTAMTLEKLLPKAYNNVFFQIKTKYRLPCWQSTDLEKLREHYKGKKVIISDGTMFFDEKFWGEKLDWIILNKNFIKTAFQKKHKNFEVRYIKHHSKKRFNVIENAAIVLNNAEGTNLEDLELYIRVCTKDIISHVNKEKIRFSKSLSEKYLQNKYYRINIYKNDMRIRSFHNLVKNENLIATFHINKTKQINNILPAWGTKEENEQCLIVWNR